MMYEIIIWLIILTPFLIFALAFSKGTGAFLIAGYNSLPESKQAQYDEVALSKFMGKVMYGFCFSILLWAISDIFEIQILLILGVILFITLIVFTFVYSNNGNKFKRKYDDKTKGI